MKDHNTNNLVLLILAIGLCFYQVDAQSEPNCFDVDIGTVVTVCSNVSITNCRINFEITMDGEVLVSEETSITQFWEVFNSNETCNSGQLCDYCTQWDNLTLSETEASGCGSISYKCLFGQNFGPYSLGCFQDSEVVAECFGGCENDCSFHGLCNSTTAVCTCDPGWAPPDCSKPVATCPNNCSGSTRGVCKNGTCECNPGWSGNDCSVMTEEQNTESGSWKSVAIGVGVAGGAALVAGAVGVGYFMKRKNNRGSPDQFQEMSDKELE
mmetsp:Transcript_29176/g.41055  ORF Transcript_29176/g.41055 Transcript_29176/m.41055 type:complete len:268 (+) Transcript_29176:571-1374(+)